MTNLTRLQQHDLHAASSCPASCWASHLVHTPCKNVSLGVLAHVTQQPASWLSSLPSIELVPALAEAADTAKLSCSTDCPGWLDPD